MRFWRSAIDFVREQDVREYRAGLENEFAFSRTRFLQNVRAENVAGHEVRRELDALEIKFENLADGFDKCGFAEARQSFEQNMTAR